MLNPRIVFAVFVFMFVVLAYGSVHAASPTSQEASQDDSGVGGAFYIFAYPGTACPPGSKLYKSPESARAKSFGAVYCKYKLTTMTFSKSKVENGTCPQGMKSHAEHDVKSDDDTVWCDIDLSSLLSGNLGVGRAQRADKK